MIRPASFQFNEQTAASNDYQQKTSLSKQEAIEKAQEEFDNMVEILEQNDINVWVIEDTIQPEKPDAVFPNNWISMHQNGDVYMYPMKALNRSAERRPDVIEFIEDNFEVSNVFDWSKYEKNGLALEGTGSMIFDHAHHKVYACISPRTNEKLLRKFCLEINYEPIVFHAYKRNGAEQYHTNVVMCIGEEFAVVCLDSITNKAEKNEVKSSLEENGYEIIEITMEQLEKHYAGNMLQVYNDKRLSFLVMSERAFKSLTTHQLNQIEAHTEIIAIPIYFIEEVGGGSARCMMAEIFLEEKN
jgi:hypothetical protein